MFDVELMFMLLVSLTREANILALEIATVLVVCGSDSYNGHLLVECVCVRVGVRACVRWLCPHILFSPQT